MLTQRHETVFVLENSLCLLGESRESLLLDHKGLLHYIQCNLNYKYALSLGHMTVDFTLFFQPECCRNFTVAVAKM